MKITQRVKEYLGYGSKTNAGGESSTTATEGNRAERRHARKGMFKKAIALSGALALATLSTGCATYQMYSPAHRALIGGATGVAIGELTQQDPGTTAALGVAGAAIGAATTPRPPVVIVQPQPRVYVPQRCYPTGYYNPKVYCTPGHYVPAPQVAPHNGWYWDPQAGWVPYLR